METGKPGSQMIDDSQAAASSGLCLDFLNTLTGRGLPLPIETLRAYADLLDWCQGLGLIPSEGRLRLEERARAAPRQALFALEQARETREALYRLLSRLISHEAPGQADQALFNDYLGEALRYRLLSLESGRPRWAWRDLCDSLTAPFYPVLLAAADLLASPDLGLARICADPDCGRLFLDRSRNHSRKWCSSSTCGNRERVRAFYRRAKESDL
jgi:predicted RNA-binding Zn ribbon-like protein